jgi:hypothetical protein
MSLRLCKYIISQGQKGLYCEKNNSDCVWSIKSCYEEVNSKDNIYFIKGLCMFSGRQYSREKSEGYPYLIEDYGELTGDNFMNFLAADIKLILLGTKDWELSYAQKVINMTAEYKDIVYLLNYIDARQFQKIIRSMDHRKCFRVPYEPDPYAELSSSELEFYRELIPFAYRRKWEKKLFTCLNLGR